MSWSCIYKLDGDGHVALFGFTGEPPVDAVRVKDYIGGVPRYVHSELGWTADQELPEVYFPGINSTVAAMLPSYSPPGSVPDETKAGTAEAVVIDEKLIPAHNGPSAQPELLDQQRSKEVQGGPNV